jgi:tRNA(fMet)-specific endonuclease VapC
MKYLLDTNICIPLLNGTDDRLEKRVKAVSREDVVLCSIVKAELDFGAKKSVRVADNLDRLRLFYSSFASLPFDDDCVMHYGTIRAFLEVSGTLIGHNDLLIGSIALANGVTLVSRNTKEFARVPGLSIELW